VVDVHAVVEPGPLAAPDVALDVAVGQTVLKDLSARHHPVLCRKERRQVRPAAAAHALQAAGPRPAAHPPAVPLWTTARTGEFLRHRVPEELT